MASPQVNCVSVAPNGDVTINWTLPSDPASEFVSYNVFAASSLNGSYSTIATINNISTTSYTWVGAGASTIPKFFYITTTSSDGSTQPATDTVRTIFLVVTATQLNTAYTSPVGGGVASLQWNPVSDPLHPGSSASYKVYRQDSYAGLVLLGTTTNTRWYDTIALCIDSLIYHIEIDHSAGCTSVSNYVGKKMTDMTDPLLPSIDSVSIDLTTGLPIMGMSPSPSPDAVCYYTYQYTGVSYLLMEMVCGNYPQLDTLNAQAVGTGIYSIASIDSCGNLSPISVSQNVMFLNYTYSLCDKSVLLGWNPYQNMKNGLKEYRIYMSLNGGPFTFVGDTTALAYTVSNLSSNQTYRFYVRAVDNTGTISSTSNIISFFSKTQPLASFVYVSRVSVTPSQNIEIGVFVDSLVNIRGIQVYRALSPTGTFTPVGYITYVNGNPAYSITDGGVETATTEYYYKAVVIDSCGLPSITSNISKSVLLKVKSNANRTNTLSWTDYQSYLGNVVSWYVYRSIDDVFDPNPVAMLPGGNFSMVDDVSDFVSNSGRFRYYVQAVEGPGNPYGLAELSNSNTVESYHSDSIFIPNAFVPKGVNKVFLPMTQYVEKTEFKLSIFDRWGQQIWQTESDAEGWDGGSFEGGLYAYVVEYKNAFGEYKRINGTVLMIR